MKKEDNKTEASLSLGELHTAHGELNRKHAEALRSTGDRRSELSREMVRGVEQVARSFQGPPAKRQTRLEEARSTFASQVKTGRDMFAEVDDVYEDTMLMAAFNNALGVYIANGEEERDSEPTSHAVLLVHHFTGWVRRTVGKQFPHLEDELNKLSPRALEELARLTNDVDFQTRREVARSSREPWKR